MTIILKILIIILNIIYFFLKLLPTQNRVLMMSRQSNNINQDFKLLGKRLEKEYQVIYLCKTLDGKENAKLKVMISYGFHMLKQMYYLATSKVCILDTYIPTISVLKHKKKLTIIQMWHSNGTMKKFGYTALGKSEGSKNSYVKILKMHQNYDIVFASGQAYASHLAKGFNIDESKIKIYSLPRIDLLTDKKYEKETKEKIYQEYPELKKRKNIVYAPTFRKDEKDFTKYLNELVDSIDYTKYNLIIKLHPLSKAKVNSTKAIMDNKFSTFDMLFITDKLISDYSCIIYEAGVRNIPLYFYNYDIADYDVVRGLALDYNELPGYTSSNANELSKLLEKEYDYEYLEKFIHKYVENTKDCTTKIVEEIKKHLD